MATGTATLAATLTVTTAGDPVLIEAGQAAYRQHYCGICHTLAAAGTLGSFGPPHDGMGDMAAQ